VYISGMDTGYNVNKEAESMIREAKKTGFNYIKSTDLDANPLSKLTKQKLLNSGLIVLSTDTPSVYVLTERGNNFKSFKEEDELEMIRRNKMKVDYKNAERIARNYWLTIGIAVVALLISLALLILKLRE
jgi:hypothetical protein